MTGCKQQFEHPEEHDIANPRERKPATKASLRSSFSA